MFRFLILLSFLFNISHLYAQKNAQDNNYSIKIKDHVFTPNLIEVPSNTSFKLVIENLDNTIEEFESDDLKKEKLVGAKKTITISINPLKAGEYKFYGDFHQKTAQGKIIVK
jgi:plastocyanin